MVSLVLLTPLRLAKTNFRHFLARFTIPTRLFRHECQPDVISYAAINKTLQEAQNPTAFDKFLCKQPSRGQAECVKFMEIIAG
jgi:hypothetical protein